MEENIGKSVNQEEKELLFLKVDQLKRGSHGLSLLLRTDDTIVALNKLPIRGSQKLFNQKLKENDENIITILRRNTFFNLKASGPLGIKLNEVSSEESEDLLKKTNEYLNKIDSYEGYKDFEVYKGSNNLYNEIEINELSLLASLLPFVWFFHHKLYTPLFLLMGTLLLLGSIAWWLFLAAWVIITIYMSKSSMSLLRGYCLFNEMKIFMKIYAKNNVEAQRILRSLDKKSHYVFPLIEAPLTDLEIERLSKKEKETSNLDQVEAQVT